MKTSALARHMRVKPITPSEVAQRSSELLHERVTAKQIKSLMNGQTNRDHVVLRRHAVEASLKELDTDALSAEYHSLFLSCGVLPVLSETPERERLIYTAVITMYITDALLPDRFRGGDRRLIDEINKLLDEFAESPLAGQIASLLDGDEGETDSARAHTPLWDFRREVLKRRQSDVGSAPRQSELENPEHWRKTRLLQRRLTAACIVICEESGRSLICFAERGLAPVLSPQAEQRLALLCALVAFPSTDYLKHAYNTIISIRERALMRYESDLRQESSGDL